MEGRGVHPRVHCLQHSERVRPLAVADWAADRGVELVVVRSDRDPLPDPDDVAALVVLGGGMNTDEASAHPWIPRERDLLRALLDRGDVPLFGICLGSQLIAEALGARVARASAREIGWQQLTTTSDAASSPVFATLPERFEAFEWHGDTWELPSGARLMVTGELCANQAFAWGDNVHAVQFHPEFTHARTVELAATTSPPLVPDGAGVQDPVDFLRDPARFAAANALLVAMLDAAFAVSRTTARSC